MRQVLALLICAALLLGLGGCGGSDDSDTASTASSTTTEATATTQPSERPTTAPSREVKSEQRKSAPEKSKSGGSGQSSGEKKSASQVRVPPISSAPTPGSRAPAPGVKTVKGADNSVQEYGIEADESARTEAATALQAYLNARASEDWAGACSFLAKAPTEQLERMQRSAAKQGVDLNGCPATMALLKEAPAQLREQASITEVLSFRGGGDVSGDPSYLIFTAPPATTLYSMPMYSQGGAWKVGLARAAELPVG
jgi:hypothetical protein